jgi:hypothetical protein
MLCSPDAAAQTSVLIVIQRNGPSEITACTQQLRSELLAEGYDPDTVQVPDVPSASVLVDTAKQLSSPAAISISLRAGVISGLVWIVDPDEPGGLLRTIAEQPMGETAPVVFAVKATNVLQGALLELGYVPPKLAATEATSSNEPQALLHEPNPSPREPDLKPKQQAQTTVTPPPSAKAPHVSKGKRPHRKHDWQLALGAESMFPVTGKPFAFGASLALNRRLGQSWALGLEGQAYLPAEASGTAASVNIYQFMAGARLDYRQYIGTRFTIYEAFSTGLHYTKVEGTASRSVGLENQRLYAYTPYHQLGLGGIWHATADFGVWVHSSLFLAWQKSDVFVVQEKVATLAGPSALIGLGMEVSF